MLTLSEHLSSPPGCSWSLVFWVVFWRSLFVLLLVFLWSLYSLSFFDLRLLITPLMASSNFPYSICNIFILSNMLYAFKPFTIYCSTIWKCILINKGWWLYYANSQLPDKNDGITQNVMFFCNDQFILVYFVLSWQDCSSDWYKFSEHVFKKKTI